MTVQIMSPILLDNRTCSTFDNCFFCPVMKNLRNRTCSIAKSTANRALLDRFRRTKKKYSITEFVEYFFLTPKAHTRGVS